MSRDGRDAFDEGPTLPGAADPDAVRSGPGTGSRELDQGPSARWAVLVAAAAALLTLVELLGVLRALPERGWQQSMIPLLLGISALAGAYSLARVLQLALYALSRPGRTRRREPSFALSQAHTLHTIWLTGLGASIAFMGLLGVWSAVDGHPSGLEPGWPLILIGAALAAVSTGASMLATRRWRGSDRR